MDKSGYSCLFGNRKLSFFHDSKLVGSGSLSSNDNLYLVDTITSFNESLQFSTLSLKRQLTNENSVVLWHRSLGHISRRRIERLVSNEIPEPLDFTEFDICVNCIKEKKPIKGDLKPIGLQMY